MIPFKSNMAVANVVLSLLQAKHNNPNTRFWIEAYSNGREQGYYLTNGHVGIAFSENRNSDSIVAYVGRSRDFSMQGNVPSDDIYQKKSLFGYDEYVEAVDMILEVIANEEKEVTE